MWIMSIGLDMVIQDEFGSVMFASSIYKLGTFYVNVAKAIEILEGKVGFF